MLVCEGSADTTWRGLIRNVYENGSMVKPRGLLCIEILAHTTRVDMVRPVTTIRPRLGYKFMLAEAWWILSGRNDVAGIAKYSPHIAAYSNDGVRFDGAYGPRVIDQVRFICDTLEEDWESRQAVLEIWRPNPRPSKDIPCTINVQWMIRARENEDGDKEYFLHCFDTMRSSDAWLGWPYDVFNFSMLSAAIAIEMRTRYVKRSEEMYANMVGNLGLRKLKLGKLHLTAASQHLYVQPKKDGASNIPYSREDVRTILNLASPPQEVPYQPLDISEFSSSQEFLAYLEVCKDKNASHWGKKWLSEFCHGQCTAELKDERAKCILSFNHAGPHLES